MYFDDTATCVNTCTDGTNALSYSGQVWCRTTCPGLAQDGVCVDSCTTGRGYLEGACVLCNTTSMKLFAGMCIETCPAGSFEHEGKCVANCPSSAPYV